MFLFFLKWCDRTQCTTLVTPLASFSCFILFKTNSLNICVRREVSLNRFIEREVLEFVKYCISILFLLKRYFGDTLRLMYKKVELICIYICRQLSIFPNKFCRIYPINLQIDMLCHMSNTYRHAAFFNPLSANPTKWSNTFKQFVGNLSTNCLSVFDHFMNLELEGLISVPEALSSINYRTTIITKITTSRKILEVIDSL